MSTTEYVTRAELEALEARFSQRLAVLESGTAQRFALLTDAINGVEASVQTLAEHLDLLVDLVREQHAETSARFEQVDQRFNLVDQRFDRIDESLRRITPNGHDQP